jgi:hypothetical protein
MDTETMSEAQAPRKSAKNTRGKPFQLGNAGKPKGTRNRTTLALEALLDGEAEALTRKAVEMALAGDGAAMRLVMDRILPPRKERPVMFAMPKLETVGDAVKATAALAEAVANGDITPGEAGELSKLVDGFTKAVELHEIQQRLDKLEAAQGQK